MPGRTATIRSRTVRRCCGTLPSGWRSRVPAPTTRRSGPRSATGWWSVPCPGGNSRTRRHAHEACQTAGRQDRIGRGHGARTQAGVPGPAGESHGRAGGSARDMPSLPSTLAWGTDSSRMRHWTNWVTGHAPLASSCRRRRRMWCRSWWSWPATTPSGIVRTSWRRWPGSTRRGSGSPPLRPVGKGRGDVPGEDRLGGRGQERCCGGSRGVPAIGGRSGSRCGRGGERPGLGSRVVGLRHHGRHGQPEHRAGHHRGLRKLGAPSPDGGRAGLTTRARCRPDVLCRARSPLGPGLRQGTRRAPARLVHRSHRRRRPTRPGPRPDQPTARITGPSPPGWWHAAAERNAR